MTGSKPRSSVVLSDCSATCATNASIKQILLYFTLILVAVINVTNARWSLPQPTAAHLHLAALTEKVTISKKFHPFFYLGMSYRFEPFLPESLLDLFWRSRHLPRRRRRRCVGNIFSASCKWWHEDVVVDLVAPGLKRHLGGWRFNRYWGEKQAKYSCQNLQFSTCAI